MPGRRAASTRTPTGALGKGLFTHIVLVRFCAAPWDRSFGRAAPEFCSPSQKKLSHILDTISYLVNRRLLLPPLNHRPGAKGPVHRVNLFASLPGPPPAGSKCLRTDSLARVRTRAGPGRAKPGGPSGGSFSSTPSLPSRDGSRFQGSWILQSHCVKFITRS